MADNRSTAETKWLTVRRYLEQHRYELSIDASRSDYRSVMRFADSPLLTRAEWVPTVPVDIRDIEIVLDIDSHSPFDLEQLRRAAGLPQTSGNIPGYRSYSDVYQKLAAPRKFDNRKTYRLLQANIASNKPRLVFGRGRYFDSLDTGEAAAHEYAGKRLASPCGSLREKIKDPCDPAQRPINLALSTLTIRNDENAGTAEFFMHWRDPKKVGHAGGLYQVIPSGVFQQVGDEDWNEDADLSLTRFASREFAEELANLPEEYDTSYGPFDYDSWSFGHDFISRVEDGRVRFWCLGLGVDPLTFATDLLTVAVFPATEFDLLFGSPTEVNDEGNVTRGLPFSRETIQDFGSDKAVQAAGAGLILAAWSARHQILS